MGIEEIKITFKSINFNSSTATIALGGSNPAQDETHPKVDVLTSISTPRLGSIRKPVITAEVGFRCPTSVHWTPTTQEKKSFRQ
ncbi:Phosphatidylinositol 3-kinase regulatory subunit beta [Manis javanica]|nr:Phosphatidylinositol 3-kinase regulatory subunit beta [Manis javanica]